MAVNVQLYDTLGTTPPPQFVFGTVPTPITPGVPTAAQTVEVWNNKGGVGADTARGVRIRWQAVVDGVAVDEGLGPLDDLWVEMKVDSGLGGLVVVPGGWVRQGTHAWLELPDLANDHGVSCSIRVSAPSSATTQTATLVPIVGFQAALPMGSGHTDSTPDGIVSRLGHFDGTEVVAWAGSLAEAGTPDATFLVPDAAWDHRGKRYSLLAHAETTDNLDGDAVALDPGEEYWITVSLGAGTVNQTKSAKGVSLPPTARPLAPAGEILRGWILRGEDGIIDTIDIESIDTLGRCGARVTTGRNIEVGTGRARVGDRLIVRSGADIVNIPASTTRDIYLQPEGTLALVETTAAPADPWSLWLYRATANATDITALVDKRAEIGPERVTLVLPFSGAWRGTPALAVDDVSPAVVVPGNRPMSLAGLRPIVLALSGSGTGSGQTIVDVERRPAGGGSFTSIFTSAGTDDRRPTVPSAAADPTDRDAVPEEVALEPGDCLRARVADLPGTTKPVDGAILLTLERS